MPGDFMADRHGSVTPKAPTRFTPWGWIALFALATVLVEIALFQVLGLGPVYWTAVPRTLGPEPLVSAVFLVPFAIPLFVRTTDRGGALLARWALVAGCVAVALSLAAAFLVEQHFPSSADEFAYLFEAETFDAGRLWNPAPVGGAALSPLYIWVHAGRWAAQYPPGWPGLLALWREVGLDVWSLGPALLAPTLVALYRLVRRRAGSEAAGLAVIVFGFAPFTTFNAGSLFSHMLAAALVTAALACVAARSDGAGPRFALAAGLLIGLLGITRSLTAAVILVPVAVHLVHRRDWRSLALIAAAGAPFVIGLLWYQWRITGDPMKPVYYFSGRNVDHLYFDRDSIKTGVIETWKRSIDLSLWTSSVLPILWLVTLTDKLVSRNLDFVDVVFPLGVLAFIFYPFVAGNKFGPRYYFDFFPCLVYTVCSNRAGHEKRLWKRSNRALMATGIFGLLLWPFLAMSFRTISTERQDLYRSVETARLHDALVCIVFGTGVKLIMPGHDLVRNDIDAAGPVLYTDCGGTTLARLARLYPDRQIWTYDRVGVRPHGILKRLR